MRELPPPFKLDLRALLAKAKREAGTRVGTVTIRLPFVSFSVAPNDLEQKVAREIVIRTADRRVLNAFECCDTCIEQASASLQDIRRLLVDKQVELTQATDGPLYVLIELMLEGIRQFLTFEQRLGEESKDGGALVLPDGLPRGMPFNKHEKYFGALEMLRAHLHRCLRQVASIADIEIPRIAQHMRYDDNWQLEAYEQPALEENAG